MTGAISHAPTGAAGGRRRFADSHPVWSTVARRAALGVVTLWLVSILVFVATQVLPGNAAYAVLGHDANPLAVHALERQLGLDRSATSQYFRWLGHLLRGNPGMSLAAREPVTQLIDPKLVNSAILIAVSAILATIVGTGLGVLAAYKRDTLLDHALSVSMLGITSLPEFIVAVVLVILFSTTVLHWLPATSLLAYGQSAYQSPRELILPVATLVLVTFPYIARMTRAALIDAMEGEYCQMATLKGAPRSQVLLRHAAPNAVAPTIQVIGLMLLYLAGGIVVVEYIFNFPGIGSALVAAVSGRDVPTIQYAVLILAAFYVCVNIATDLLVLAASPRRRLPRG